MHTHGFSLHTLMSVLKLGILLDEIDKIFYISAKARTFDPVLFEELTGLGRVVFLLDKEIRHAVMRKARDHRRYRGVQEPLCKSDRRCEFGLSARQRHGDRIE